MEILPWNICSNACLVSEQGTILRKYIRVSMTDSVSKIIKF